MTVIRWFYRSLKYLCNAWLKNSNITGKVRFFHSIEIIILTRRRNIVSEQIFVIYATTQDFIYFSCSLAGSMPIYMFSGYYIYVTIV